MEKIDPEPFDCFKIQCDDACCQYGVDVWETERDDLIRLGLATEKDFLEREVDEEGLVCYRTAQGNRGCTFLNPDRGCRLYPDHKPSLCYLFPRSLEEVLEAHEDGYLPCVEKYKAIFQSKQPHGGTETLSRKTEHRDSKTAAGPAKAPRRCETTEHPE